MVSAARLAPVRTPTTLIPWMGPRLLPPIANGDPSRVWVGQPPDRRPGQGMPKMTPDRMPLRGVARCKRHGPAFFQAMSALERTLPLYSGSRSPLP